MENQKLSDAQMRHSRVFMEWSFVFGTRIRIRRSEEMRKYQVINNSSHVLVDKVNTGIVLIYPR